MSDPTRRAIIEDVIERLSLDDTTKMRVALGQAYDAGASEAAAASIALGDPGADARDALHFAIASRLVLDHDPRGHEALRSALETYITRY